MKSQFNYNSILFLTVISMMFNFTSCTKKDDPIIDNNPPPITGPSITLTADFSVNNGIGHPYVFGENGALSDPTTATKMANQGFTFKRTGCDMDWLLGNPATITLDSYLSDVNGVRTNPAKVWFSNATELINFGAKGIKFIATIGYVPTWLSFNPTSVNGVPKDWTVYEELVQKVYQKYKTYNCVEYIEIWNEPTGQFLDLTGSPYTTRYSAYKDIYYHTAKAIRAVDTAIPLGGPTAGDSKAWCIAWADSMLNDPRIAKDVNFLSYHLYDKNSGSDPSDIANWKAVATKYGKTDMPIFITEWNYSYDLGIIPMNNESPDAISFVGKRLTDFYVNHLVGANIYAMWPYDSTNKWRQDMCGFFTDGTFMPKARTFYLMSKVLSLGKGESALKQTTWTAGQNITNAGSAITIDNQKVVWMTNDTRKTDSISIIIKGLVPTTQFSASVWEASVLNSAQSERQSIKFSVDATGKGGFKFAVAAKSVTGFIIK